MPQNTSIIQSTKTLGGGPKRGMSSVHTSTIVGFKSRSLRGILAGQRQVSGAASYDCSSGSERTSALELARLIRVIGTPSTTVAERSSLRLFHLTFESHDGRALVP